MAQIGLLAAVPGILIAGPLIGLFGGKWLDGKFGTEPYLMITGIVLGFVSAGIETWSLIKKSRAMDESPDKDSEKNK